MDLSHRHCQLLRNLQCRGRRTQQRHQTSTWITRVLGILGGLKIIVVRCIRPLHLGLERRRGIRHRPLRVHIISKLLMRRRRRVGVGGVDRVIIERRRLRGIRVGPTPAGGWRRIRRRRHREGGGDQIRVSISIANITGEALRVRVGSGDGGRLLRRRSRGFEQFMHIEWTSAWPWCVGIARGSHHHVRAARTCQSTKHSQSARVNCRQPEI